MAFLEGHHPRLSISSHTHAFFLQLMHPPVSRQPARNPEEDNSVAEVYFQCGPDNLAERAALDMLAQVWLSFRAA